MSRALYSQDYGEKQARTIPAPYIHLLETWLALTKNDSFLEVGSGSGYLLHRLKKRVRTILGLEVNPYFAQHSLEKKHVLIGSATNLPIKNSHISKSVSIHVIEHILDLHTVFMELDRVSKPKALSLHIFPAPYLFRQEGALFQTMFMSKNPFTAWKLAGQLHVHKLSPKHLQAFLVGTSWKMVRTKKLFVPGELGFSWAVLLQKET